MAHYITHWLKWNLVSEVVTEWRGRELWVGFVCCGCGQIQGWHTLSSRSRRGQPIGFPIGYFPPLTWRSILHADSRKNGGDGGVSFSPGAGKIAQSLLRPPAGNNHVGALVHELHAKADAQPYLGERWLTELALDSSNPSECCSLAHLTRLGQPDGISPSRMAEMLEVDKAGPKVRC